MSGILIAAPSSGSGKTTITLALLRLLSREGIAVRGAKSGPDYIDPRFHEAACGAPCLNLDAWAMTPDRLRALAQNDGLLIVEGAMGLFDGAPPDGKGSAADLARILGLPVILVVDAARMAGSVAPLVKGFARHDPQIHINGLILNNVGSDRHERMLRRALEPTNIPIIATMRRSRSLTQPSRHLGLVQAQEHPALETFLNDAADALAETLDRGAFVALTAPLTAAGPAIKTPPPAQTIALARDAAFAFSYPHQLQDWASQGAEIRFFSPLANDPVPEAEFVFLPGGYPELHAAKIAAAGTFMTSLRNAAKDTRIYGECGGYMVLGKGLTDAGGIRHKMAGLLDLETSFETRKLHLGYRNLTPLGGPFSMPLKGHEFHYATTLHAAGTPLFCATDAEGASLPHMGLINGNVCGSFAHVIDQPA